MTTIPQEIKDASTLNDMLRQTLLTGEIQLSAGIKALPSETQKQVLEGVKNYNSFGLQGKTKEMKDLGGFSCDDHDIFWQIDCYGEDGVWTCENHDDPEKVGRVLKIMLMDEA